MPTATTIERAKLLSRLSQGNAAIQAPAAKMPGHPPAASIELIEFTGRPDPELLLAGHRKSPGRYGLPYSLAPPRALERPRSRDSSPAGAPTAGSPDLPETRRRRSAVRPFRGGSPDRPGAGTAPPSRPGADCKRPR